RHARAGEHTGIALHFDLAALHAGAEIGAGIALDGDLALFQTGADLVAAPIGAGQADRLGILASHLETIADRELVARRANDERFYLLPLQLLELRGGERREVEPLVRLALELEAERAH